MEIIIPQDRLAKALNIVSRVTVNLKTALPMLNNVLIRADGNKLSITATNMELATVCFLGAKIVKNGTITVPAKLLAEFVSNLPRGVEVKLIAKDNKLTVEAGKYRSVVNGTSADDYPELPQIDKKKMVALKVGTEAFSEAVGAVMIASSNDTTRPALTGVYFNTHEGTLYMAATDGYRLAEKNFIENVDNEVFAIVPTTSLSEVLRSIGEEMDEMEILFDESGVQFRLGEIEIISKLIDGNFPDYRQLIPKKTEISVLLERAELVRATKLAALFAKESGGSIVCETSIEKKAFLMSSVASEFGGNSSEIEAEIEADGRITLNSRFLLDAINTISEDKLLFGFSGKLAPVVVRNEKAADYAHIIMPLKS